MSILPPMTHRPDDPGRRRLITTMLGGALAVTAGGAAAAPSADLWPRWLDHDPTDTRRIDHGVLAQFLDRYRRRRPDGVAGLAYGAVSAADHGALAGYVETLTAQPVTSLNRAEQFACWVNLYNAATVRVVLDHYPVASIRDIDISPGLFANGPWGAALGVVEGHAITLDDIEHRILRPIWGDARVHYVVNCASVGCPDLPARPVAATDRDAQLDAAASAFVNHPRGVAASSGGDLVVSSIYHWFAEDFGGDDRNVISHLQHHAAAGLAADLAGRRRIDDHRYDWSLNLV